MPTMANIVLEYPPETDNTFKPMSLVDNMGTYSNVIDGTVQSWPKITISVRPAQVSNNGHKVTLRVTLPLARMEDEGTCCVPRGTPLPANVVTIEFLRHNQSSQAAAEEILAYLQQVVNDTQFTACALGESLR